MSIEAQVVEVKPESYSYVFSPYREPIVKVRPGDRVMIHCNDAFESRINTKDDIPSKALATAKFLNPQTGPIYVDGAEPGDTLAVRIESIEPTRDFAVSCLVPYFGGLTSTTSTRTRRRRTPARAAACAAACGEPDGCFVPCRLSRAARAIPARRPRGIPPR
jgi:acetamidase/formamidase